MTDAPVLSTDILGEPYRAETLILPDDSEGPVVATLVSRPADAPSRRAVLYIPGFCDYFFQTHVAEFCNALGYDFYALDMRKYGRSLMPHQTPNFCRDLHEYYAELDEAYKLVSERDEHDTIVLIAHSTGGLIASLWAHDRHECGMDVPAAFVLNSPWLDLQGSLILRTVGTRAIDEIGARRPYQVIPRGVSGVYVESLHRDRRGEWDFRLDWKPAESFPVRAGWLRAVRRGHRRMHRGLDVGAPVLVLASARTTFTEDWTDDVPTSDVVLDVEQIARWSHRLGTLVTIGRLDGARHDVFLSEKAVRDEAFTLTTRWLQAVVPAQP